MQKALPYAGWALLIALLIIWAGQKFFGKWIESAASAIQEWIIGRFISRRWFRRTALRRYAAALLEDYDKIPVPFIEREDQRPSMRKIYVPLQTLDEEDRRLESDAYSNVRSSRRSIVLGPPGSGKSMLLKNSIIIWAEDFEHFTRQKRFWRHAYSAQKNAVPVLVELRRCVFSEGIPGIINLITDQFSNHGFRRSDRFVDRSLDEGSLTILFDGLDEVATANRKQICSLLTDFASKYMRCQIVVTCRTAIYQGQLSERFADIVRVADFDDAQIRRFMRNWQRRPADPVADQLLQILREAPRLMQLARNPLLLTLIAYLYAYRGKEAKLPRSRAQFYREATDFLLRNKPELDYSQGTKMAVLQRLALVAQDTPASDLDRQVLSYGKVISTIKDILPSTVLREDDIQPLLDEIVMRSGIIKQIRGEQSFHFAHLTLQEFLAAAELADRPDDLIRRYRSDPTIWRETIKLWCGYVSRDSKAIISAVLDSDPVLAFECLADAVQVDESLARKITDYHEENLKISEANGDTVIQAFGAVASDYSPRGQAVLNFLTGLAGTPDDPRHEAALRALAASKLPRAAEVLAGLYPNSRPASDALRTMGDLAVPAYANHAGQGELAAIDDLAAIATPAAARELVCLLSSDTTTAIRAAWQITSLIQNPDVEEALRISDDLPVPSGQRLDPVWAPFQQQATSQWLEIMGRVAYLVDQSPDDAIPSVAGVDRRVAIPLCAVRVNNILNKQSKISLPHEYRLELEKAISLAAKSRHRQTDGQPNRPQFYIPNIVVSVSGEGRIDLRTIELGFILFAISDDIATEMFRSILRHESLGRVHEELFVQLTPKVQRRIFENACHLSSRPISLSAWPDSFTPVVKPKLLTRISGTLTALATAGAIGLSIYSTIEVVKRSGHGALGGQPSCR